MILTRFQVKSFRTVEDSGWVDIDEVTSLIGENESGKTNLLIPLWKLNPAVQDSDSKLDLIKDYPRMRYFEIESASADSDLKLQKFVVAEFDLDESDIIHINQLFGTNSLKFNRLQMSRNYNDKVAIEIFFDNKKIWPQLFDEYVIKYKKIFQKIKGIDYADKVLNLLENINLSNLTSFLADKTLLASLTSEQKVIVDEFTNNSIEILRISKCFLDTSEIQKIVPKFIYYSNYGNLDSEIYLPDVINEFEGDRYKGNKTKGRTIGTLFKFVKLSPKQIYELGLPPQNSSPDLVIAKQAENKKRAILLESASSSFTKRFNEWWGQGLYTFKFEADGNYFRIKVSDNIRTTPLELESRSSGLQWFFSFFLVFLVESEGLHKNAILLLDEPGVTLHPNSQKNLYIFFDNLARTNQLLYTTHSPFMINSNNLERVYAVYVNEIGNTKVTPDLRNTSNARQNNSIYPAHAALGLSVSDTILQGCIPVVVEGPSDQIYLSLIKNFVIKNGKVKTQKEIVFIPGKGIKGIKPILAMISSIQTDPYPYVIIDGDTAGEEFRKALAKELYAGNEDKILSIKDFKVNFEVEDLLPHDFFVSVVDSFLIKSEDRDESFKDVANITDPMCDQIDAYAADNGIQLKLGYKVEIARRFKQRILKKGDDLLSLLTKEQLEFIENIFKKVTQS